ncbi:MAG: hypothetical protein ACK57Y_01950, partial [Pirellulaceae bacterium]
MASKVDERNRQPRSHHRQMLDDPEPTSFENIHRYLRSHHRQMVDDAETTSFEDIHRVAAVATGRRCETHEK